MPILKQKILALQWKHVAEDQIDVVHGLPWTLRSTQEPTLNPESCSILHHARCDEAMAPATPSPNSNAWIFPSSRTSTPIGRDNAWRRLIAPRLKTAGLEWAM